MNNEAFVAYMLPHTFNSHTVFKIKFYFMKFRIPQFGKTFSFFIEKTDMQTLVLYRKCLCINSAKKMTM